FFHLVIPQHALIFHFFFFSKVFNDKDRLISYLRFFNTELKKFFLRSIKPVKSYKLFVLAFEDFCPLSGAIPGKIENIVSFIDSIGEPFLQTCRRRKEFV